MNGVMETPDLGTDRVASGSPLPVITIIPVVDERGGTEKGKQGLT